ncbi:Acetyltransferase (GNAT) family protein [Amycolatopsis arida]|uniref:Acetyltransferase (GNAT) family protein n=2 Tax=Amycolatopsis arida TaxID=587909 RepID=A0A1I5VIB4_9PSEU|nr:acetyltransferase (GNAT) family protein [Amycolatopsis arida]SFQ07161.1 Acetyltransferase (GNAT) family protein [Amycolatopsis arida]
MAPWRDRASAERAAYQWLVDSLASAARGQGEVYVAVDGPHVVGVVSVGEQQHSTGAVDAYVGELAVAAEAVRMGAGRRLMTAAEEWARARGLPA